MRNAIFASGAARITAPIGFAQRAKSGPSGISAGIRRHHCRYLLDSITLFAVQTQGDAYGAGKDNVGIRRKP